MMKKELRLHYASALKAVGFDVDESTSTADMIAAIRSRGHEVKKGMRHDRIIDSYLSTLKGPAEYVPVKVLPREPFVKGEYRPRKHFRDADIEAAQPSMMTPTMVGNGPENSKVWTR